MTRLLASHSTHAPAKQVVALQNFLRMAIAEHDVVRFIIVVRDSPLRGESRHEARTASTSIARQSQFLDAVLPNGVPRQYITLPETSGYFNSTVTDHIRDALAAHSGKALVVSTSLERIVRDQQSFDDLQLLLLRHGHMAMSCLWYSSINIEPAEAMLLQDKA
jgi:hypothetical protein